jgi:hypothetical protein
MNFFNFFDSFAVIFFFKHTALRGILALKKVNAVALVSGQR